jgi:RimJ/RimL family protein N-acetyltransferase
VATRFETARLVIRSFEDRDSARWFSMVSEPEFRRYLPPAPAPTGEAFVATLERYRELERERGLALWAVELKASGVFIGQCGLQPIEATGPEVELAYHFTRLSWGNGYATEAAIGSLAQGFGSAGLVEVIAIVMSENIASRRVVEKAGMEYVGLASYYGLADLKKYRAERSTWGPVPLSEQ